MSRRPWQQGFPCVSTQDKGYAKGAISMTRLCLDSVTHRLAGPLTDTFRHQVQESDHPDYGGVIRADWDLADSGTTVGFVASGLFFHLARVRLAADAPSQPDTEA